ncbi:MAG TPA: peptide-methionine (S)-S-oxide reductase MsrA [Gallionellaceae bacterium]|nr:peptide-methionine (S)-S-oxide reductase MsrA [Gallionellaceae bacterium]
MNGRLFLIIPLTLLALGCSGKPQAAAGGTPVAAQIVNNDAQQTAVFAGGCFWGVDAVFRHVKGVTQVESGYAGGSANTAHYKMVSTGATGHAESVLVRFDPAQVTYRQLLEVFFKVVHDPTTRDRQGPDAGPQYRAVIFYTSAAERTLAGAYIRRLTAEHAYSGPIVTEVTALPAFYPAEACHQDFYAQHRYMGYIQAYDVPKIRRLRERFPALYRGD